MPSGSIAAASRAHTTEIRCSYIQTTSRNWKHAFTKALLFWNNKKLNSRRETARCFVSLSISLRHSRSLKITRKRTNWKLGYDFLFAFYNNYGRIFSEFDSYFAYLLFASLGLFIFIFMFCLFVCLFVCVFVWFHSLACLLSWSLC